MSINNPQERWRKLAVHHYKMANLKTEQGDTETARLHIKLAKQFEQDSEGMVQLARPAQIIKRKKKERTAAERLKSSRMTQENKLECECYGVTKKKDLRAKKQLLRHHKKVDMEIYGVSYIAQQPTIERLDPAFVHMFPSGKIFYHSAIYEPGTVVVRRKGERVTYNVEAPPIQPITESERNFYLKLYGEKIKEYYEKSNAARQKGNIKRAAIYIKHAKHYANKKLALSKN
jgi:hypothetical protein